MVGASSVIINSGTGTSVDTYTVGSNHRERLIAGHEDGFHGTVTSFLEVGDAAVSAGKQNLMVLINKTGSTKTIKIVKADIDVVQTEISTKGFDITMVAPRLRALKYTVVSAFTGGTVRTPVSFDTGYSVGANTEVRDCTSGSDNSTFSAISTGGVTAGANIGLSEEFMPRLFNSTGTDTIGYEKAEKISFISIEKPVILAANECFLIYSDNTGGDATGQAAAIKWLVTIEWYEYT